MTEYHGRVKLRGVRILLTVVLGVVVLFVGSLAFNAASTQDRWPGVLDLVRKNPWMALVLLVPLAAVALWPQAPDTVSRPPGPARSDRAPTSTFRIPPRNATFTGRQGTLESLHDALAVDRTVAVQAIQGMGGVGKTQLAVEYAYRHLDAYTFIGFIDAERPQLIPSQFVVLAVQLGIQDPVADQAPTDVYEVLSRRPPWLIIFDNANSPQELRDLLPAGKNSGGGDVIITTRNRGWASHGRTLELDVFARAESVSLLRARAPSLSADAADRIAELFDDLPLAVAQAAAYLDYSGMPHTQYVELLTNRLDEMIALGEVTDRPGVAIATLWGLNLHSLDQAEPAAVTLLQLCALMAPEPFPLDLLTSHPRLLSGRLQQAAIDPIAWNEVVGAIVGRSLARRDDTRLVVHRLVQAAIRRGMPARVRRETYATARRLLVADAPSDVRDHPTRWQRWQELLPHALAVCEPRTDSAESTDVATLLRVSARYIRNVGEPLTARPLAERALAIDEVLLSEDHVDMAEDLHTLAQILRDLGEPTHARPLVERALAIHENTYGADDRTVAYDLALLAIILRDLGEPVAAQPVIQRALRLDTASHGPEHGYVADDLTTLSRILHDQGELAQARTLAERAIEIDEDLYGPAHTYVGVDLTVLAGVLHSQGDHAGSLAVAQRALEILESRSGYDYRWTPEDRATLRRLTGADDSEGAQ